MVDIPRRERAAFLVREALPEIPLANNRAEITAAILWDWRWPHHSPSQINKTPKWSKNKISSNEIRPRLASAKLCQEQNYRLRFTISCPRSRFCLPSMTPAVYRRSDIEKLNCKITKTLSLRKPY
ncbi:hypothetical protein TNCV_406571 [Trichonephila clavipes]|nr:hypothetical protein TNCV_406571 [Trichonephila clavipes]